METLIVFDLDGTLIEDVHGLMWGGPLPKSKDAVQMASEFAHVAVATNQGPRVGALGLMIREDVQTILRRLGVPVAVMCGHRSPNRCACRKPKPGMLNNLVQELESVYGKTIVDRWMVGDKWSDVEAGRRAGFRTVLIGEYPYVQKGLTPVPDGIPPPQFIAEDVAAAVHCIRAVHSHEVQLPWKRKVYRSVRSTTKTP